MSSTSGNKWRVGCPDGWAPEVKERILAVAPEELEVVFAPPGDAAERDRIVAESDFLLMAGTKVDAAFLAGAPKVRLIHRWGIGYDNVDLRESERLGVGVAITAGANSHAVAEHTIMLMLATLRKLSVVDRALREGRWLFREMRAQCFQLAGRTVGIVGLGNIGRAVARRLQGFEAQIIYYDPRPAPKELEEALHAKLVTMDEVLATADIVTLHCPGGVENRHLLGAPQFARMKQGAVLINAARGELVDPAALHDALTSGKLMGAGLDVFEQEPPTADNPLLRLDNVTLSPHTAASVLDNVDRVARHAFTNMQRVIRNEVIPEADRIVAPRRHSA